MRDNPLCKKYNNPLNYIAEVKEIFPGLINLVEYSRHSSQRIFYLIVFFSLRIHKQLLLMGAMLHRKIIYVI